MKALLVIFVFSISYVTSLDKYAVKTYPKKVVPFGNGQILINSPKFLKSNLPESALVTGNGINSAAGIPMKKKGAPLGYTVFQMIGNSRAVRGVPESPYFSVDQPTDQKPRVKKVLPDYVWSSLGRIKRSALQGSVTTVTPEAGNETKSETDSTNKPPEADEKKADEKKENPLAKKEGKDTAHEDLAASNKDLTTLKQEDVKLETSAVSKHTAKREIKSKTENKERNSKRSGTSSKSKKLQGKERSHMRARAHSSKHKSANGTRSKRKLKSKANGKHDKVVMRAKNSKNQKKNKSKKKTNINLLRHPKRQNKKSDKKKSVKKDSFTNVKVRKDTRRLTGARQAMIEDYPYVVSIQKDGHHWCSGALLNPRLVITTANCLWKANRISRMEVRCGSTYADQGGQVANIQEVIKHPRWGLRKAPDNDVALLLLDRIIKFSHKVHGVDLPNRVMLPAFDDAWVTSFGSERRDGIYEEYENSLQVYHSFLMSNESCNNVTTRFGVAVSENFICFSQTGKSAPCTRDTGAPAVSDGVLWGLASWSIRKLCGTERFPSVFSYLASHSNMDFITEATRQLMSDERQYQYLDRSFRPKLRRPATTKDAQLTTPSVSHI